MVIEAGNKVTIQKRHAKPVNLERRGEILAAAMVVFCEKGFRNARVIDIARRAQASKETIYSWFGSKEKLFETLFKEAIGNFQPKVPPTMLVDPPGVLHHLAHGILNYVNSPIFPLMMAMVVEGAKFEPTRRIARNNAMRGREELAARFNLWRVQGLMQFDNADEAAGMFMAMAMGDWANRRALGIIKQISKKQMEAHAVRATSMFLKAVAPGNPGS